jgi:hypothetical protein
MTAAPTAGLSTDIAIGAVRQPEVTGCAVSVGNGGASRCLMILASGDLGKWLNRGGDTRDPGVVL